MTLSSLIWVCLGVWLAFNGFVAVRLALRFLRSQTVKSASWREPH